MGGRNIRLTVDISTEIWKARKGWHDIFRALNEKNMQPRTLYPARLSFGREGEIKSFQDRQKWKEYVTIKPVLQEILSEDGASPTPPQKKICRNWDYTGNTMTLNLCLSIGTLNANGLNAIVKRHSIILDKKQDPPICPPEEKYFRPLDTFRPKMRWRTV